MNVVPSSAVDWKLMEPPCARAICMATNVIPFEPRENVVPQERPFSELAVPLGCGGPAHGFLESTLAQDFNELLE